MSEKKAPIMKHRGSGDPGCGCRDGKADCHTARKHHALHAIVPDGYNLEDIERFLETMRRLRPRGIITTARLRTRWSLPTTTGSSTKMRASSLRALRPRSR